MRPARSNGRPSWSTMTKSPSMRTGPLFRIVIFAGMASPRVRRGARHAPVSRPPSSSTIPPPMAPQFIFTMHKVGKVHPPNREVLGDIFALLLTPARRSASLARTAPGRVPLASWPASDPDYIGEARPPKGIRIGFLPQEPDSTPDRRTCSATSSRAWRRPRGLLDRFHALNLKLGEDLSPDAMESVMEEHGSVMAEIEARNAWELDRTIEIAMDALRVPPGETPIATLSGGERRRVALCRLMLSPPRHAPPRRADESPRRRVGGLAGAPSQGSRHGRGGDPRPLLPRQRGRLDPRA